MKKFVLAVPFVVSLALFISGCQSEDKSATSSVPAKETTIATPAAPNAAASTAPKVAPIAGAAIRIKAGGSGFTDSKGNVWLGDQGFEGGDTVERPDANISNTTDPAIYRSEHYSMDSFSWPLANGKYLVKLHFCETYENIDGPGQRVFSFNVQGVPFKDFDVWAKAGGPLKAYVETVPVDITNGKLSITFTSNVENPQINGIEIIPQS
jgi:hypothetical protein